MTHGLRRAALRGLFALACFAPAVARAQQPQIGSIDPASVPVGTGDFTLTIDGAGFAGNARLQFNGAQIPGISVTPTRIVARIPAKYISQDPWVNARDFQADGRARLQAIVINGPLSDSPNAMKIFYLTKTAAPVEKPRATPILTSVSPATVSMGSSFVVEGDNFDVPNLGVSLVARDRNARISSWGRDRHLFNRSKTRFMVGTTEVPSGSYMLVIDAMDERGNSLARFERPVVVGEATPMGAPTIANVGPRPYLPGARLTISGTNYADDATVTLVPASSQPPMTLARAGNTTPSQTSLTVVIPPTVYPGPHTLRIQNGNGGVVEQKIVVVHPSAPDESRWADNDGRLPPAPAPAPAPGRRPVRPGMRPRPGMPVTTMPVRPAVPARAVAGKLWNDPSNFDLKETRPDYGIYWFRTATDGRKSGGTGQNDGYFNPNKPTVIYVHGWQQDTHLNAPTDGVDRRRETLNFHGVDAVELWKKPGDDWNVGIFYWDAFANENENIDGAKPPWKAEPKIWTTRGPEGMRWRQADGSFVLQPAIEKDAGTLFVEAYIEAMRGTSAPEIRIVGHSLGNQMAVRLAKEIGDRVARGELPASMMPKRVALLDPYWTRDAKDWLGGRWTGEVVREYVRDLKRTRRVVFEQYQSSNMNDWFMGDKNEALQTMTAFMRLDPDYVDAGWGGMDPKKRFANAHGAAIEWYFRSKATGTVLCTRNLVNALDFTRTALPSAAMPTAQVATFMNNGGSTWYRQSWGEDNPDPQGDCFEKQ